MSKENREENKEKIIQKRDPKPIKRTTINPLVTKHNTLRCHEY